MGKKSKRRKVKPEALDVEAASISYTDYNTIMSIQLLISRLNEVIEIQREIRSQVSGVRQEVDSISAYLMVPGDMQDGNKGQSEGNEEDETERGPRQDPPAGTDE